MKVSDERRGAARVDHSLLDLGDGRSRGGLIHRHSHELGAGRGEFDALASGGGRVCRVGQGHRLHGDRCATTNADVTDAYFNCASRGGVRNIG